MTAGYEVRPFRSADLQGAAHALVEVHRTDGYPVEGVETPEEWISSPSVIQSWVAARGDHVVGHVSLMETSDVESATLWRERGGDESQIAALARLFVLREARGCHLGEKLVRTAMEYAQQRGIRLVLDVMIKDAAAIRLYERLGWLRIGSITHRHGVAETAAVAYVWPAPARE